jgi:DNA-binding ferritin-like protein
MESDDEIYEETVARGTAEPEVETRTIEQKKTDVRGVGAIETEYKSVTVQEDSVSQKAKEAAGSLRELVRSLGKKTKQMSKEAAEELKAQSIDIGATKDSQDIQHLGENVEVLTTVFEDTLADIRKEPYDEQERLLVGYKKLLEEQINVINARMDLAKRLKPGS